MTCLAGACWRGCAWLAGACKVWTAPQNDFTLPAWPGKIPDSAGNVAVAEKGAASAHVPIRGRLKGTGQHHAPVITAGCKPFAVHDELAFCALCSLHPLPRSC